MAAQNKKVDEYLAVLYAISIPCFTASPAEESLTQAPPVTSKQAHLGVYSKSCGLNLKLLIKRKEAPESLIYYNENTICFKVGAKCWLRPTMPCVIWDHITWEIASVPVKSYCSQDPQGCSTVFLWYKWERFFLWWGLSLGFIYPQGFWMLRSVNLQSVL